MAITRVGTDASAISNTGTVSPTYPTGIGAGNLILVVVSDNSASTMTTPTGYTVVDSQITSTHQIKLFAKKAAGTESGALAISVAGNRTCAAILVRQGTFTSVAANISAVVKDTFTSAGTARTATALTSVPSGAWLQAAAGSINSGSSGSTCTVSGTHWTESIDTDQGGSSSHALLVCADNTTDTGTANAPVFTWTNSQSKSGILSFWLFEDAVAPRDSPFFWSM